MDIVTLTEDNFKAEVLEAETPVIVDFWAPWCMPCRMLSPTIDEIARENGDSVKVGKVNVDEQPELAERFEVLSIPMLLVIENGEIKKSSVGGRSKQQILEMLK